MPVFDMKKAPGPKRVKPRTPALMPNSQKKKEEVKSEAVAAKAPASKTQVEEQKETTLYFIYY